MLKARQVDERRRITLPAEFEPGSNVLIEQVNEDTWLVTRHRSRAKVKMVIIPIVERLPDDPQWNKVERAFARAARKTLQPPEED